MQNFLLDSKKGTITNGKLNAENPQKIIISKIKIKMSIIKFSDGEVFDTSGDLRTELRSDGWYVLGNGFLIAVDTKEKGENKISELKTELNSNGKSI